MMPKDTLACSAWPYMLGQSATVTNAILLDDMDAHKVAAAKLKHAVSGLQREHAAIAKDNGSLRNTMTAQPTF